jgi:hypothetical protein
MGRMPIYSIDVFTHPTQCAVAIGSGTAARHDLVVPGGNIAVESSP